MPIFTKQENKVQFIDDIGNMIAQNSIIKTGAKNSNYLNAFNAAKEYFNKQKNPETRKLASYIQNFINVYNAQQNSKDGAYNEYPLDLITNINTMGSGFTEAYNQYIKDNKYTALKNSNVKLLSAMVQIAENMKHRVEMEDRKETIDFIKGELDYEKSIILGSAEEYSQYIYDCDFDGINFVEPDEQLKEYKVKFEESKRLCESLQKTKDEVEKGSDGSQDLREAEECRNKLLEHSNKITVAENKIQKLRELKTSLTVFRAESQAVSERIDSYSVDIAMDKEYIKQAENEIRENQAKVDEGDRVQKRFDELKEEQVMLEYAMAETRLQGFEEDLLALNEMSSEVTTIKDIIGKKELTPFEKVSLMQYERVKESMCDAIPELVDGFNNLENNPKYDMASLLKEYNDPIMNNLEERRNDLKAIQGSSKFKEYQELSEKISVAESSRNNIKELKRTISGYKEDIQRKEELIGETKINSGLGRQIKETLSQMPQEPITEKKLIDAMNQEITLTQNEVQNLKKSPEPAMLMNKMKEAEQRANDKNLVKINQKLTSESVKFNKIQDKLEKLKGYATKYFGLKTKIDKIFDRRQIVHKDNMDLKKINPNKEIFDRLNAIQQRFNQKTNNKMNVDCRNMMNQLGDAIKKFDPNNVKNPYSLDEKIDALSNLKKLSVKYQQAMAAKHIPKWLASEQRMLRISCAEEMESFSDIAKAMVENIKQNETTFDSAVFYAETPVDERLKQRQNDLAMSNAAIKVKLQDKCKVYQEARDKRHNAPEVQKIQESPIQSEAKLV